MRRGIVLIICCVGLAACGGSSGSGSTKATKTGTVTTSAAISNAAFAAQLSSSCKRANAAYNSAKGQSGQVAAIQHFLTDVQGLKAPSQLDSAFALYLAVIAKELRALKRGDSAGLGKIRDSQAGPLVRQLGATGCYG
jgi:hypothetical protein